MKVVQPQCHRNGKSRDARVLDASSASRRVSRLATSRTLPFPPLTYTKMADPRQRIIIKVSWCSRYVAYYLTKVRRYSENIAIRLVPSRWSSWRTSWIGMRFLMRTLSMP